MAFFVAVVVDVVDIGSGLFTRSLLSFAQTSRVFGITLGLGVSSVTQNRHRCSYGVS